MKLASEVNLLFATGADAFGQNLHLWIDLCAGANLLHSFPRRGDRVADCASLERMCAGNGTEGSNPSLSARLRPKLVLANEACHGLRQAQSSTSCNGMSIGA